MIAQEEWEKAQNSYLQSKLSQETMRSTINNMRIQMAQLKELPYLPHMQGQADMITEDISLLQRLFLPIKKILKENI